MNTRHKMDSVLSRWQRKYLPHHTLTIRQSSIPLSRPQLRRLFYSCLALLILYYFVWQIPARSRKHIQQHEQWVDYAFNAPRKVQVFMPIGEQRAKKNADFCRSLFPAVVNGYRVTLYNWDVDAEDEFDTHKPKVTSLSSILSSSRLLQQLGIFPQDLILLVDAIDIILQLSPSVLISRYSLIPEGQQGRPITAGSFNCYPNEANSSACLNIPPSPMPIDLFKSDRDILRDSQSRLPIHANSGLVLGSVSEMRGLFRKLNDTLMGGEYPYQPDQGVFNIHLSQGDLTVDNTLSMFWCAEHLTNSLSLLSSADQISPWDKYQYPFTISPSDLPSSRLYAKDIRTGNIPVALHFNGIGAKPGYAEIWEQMFPSVRGAEYRRIWEDETVKIIVDGQIHRKSVRELCGSQLGYQ
ncbi:hypothetical protein I302_103933 [Kwoniella bestiolae CBS 10118]|uniref:Uncharacterized protein n=1 Tax=Kwoniella bestiolae CBS 10118 TaxID=1296100 RepID=A0A1B9G9Y7_9TREE|nr:hypothetical protein I302_02639 [Kwoniella bestiolae CBS 10118]OCF27790.1 hypothetical protein I302_02639 [Kwoniella bestiolae CBS 10118]